ncbi:four-carbon acid sugar kinase family protein [Streptomyces sp. NPDC047072]|uniref:four-carbon acid sugar kinase family protein n=1 Tax=Streptomyces sp. NPDC047072 TaxID=3154809 RepID=UPI0033CCB36A
MSLTAVTDVTAVHAVDRPVLALADDLSGAAETAVALGLPGQVLLGPLSGGLSQAAGAGTVVVDLDSRQLTGEEAGRAVRTVTAQAPEGATLFKKVDSLLRGNLAAEAAAYAEGCAGVVIATALPPARRTVRDGVVRLDGVPLHATAAWQAESRPAPESVAAALGDVPTAPVPLAVVRGGHRALRDALTARIAQGRHPVCDAETDADLDAIARSALELGSSVRLLGTGGLAGAVGRALGRGGGSSVPGASGSAGPRGIGSPTPVSSGSSVPVSPGSLAPPESPAPPSPATTHRPLLVVVGSAEPSAAQQVTHLVAEGAHHIPLTADDLLRAGRPLVVPPEGVTVVRIAGLLAPGSARRLVAALAETVAASAYDCDLVLTGGETARRVLDALRVSHLRPVGQIHHGAVHSHTPDGRQVVTRPGSYGEADSLLRIVRALRRPASVRPVPTDHPTGVTS